MQISGKINTFQFHLTLKTVTKKISIVWNLHCKQGNLFKAVTPPPPAFTDWPQAFFYKVLCLLKGKQARNRAQPSQAGDWEVSFRCREKIANSPHRGHRARLGRRWAGQNGVGWGGGREIKGGSTGLNTPLNHRHPHDATWVASFSRD